MEAIQYKENSRKSKTSLSMSLSVISDKDGAVVEAINHQHAVNGIEILPTLWNDAGRMCLDLAYRSSLGD
jgi:hypothetical protein